MNKFRRLQYIDYDGSSIAVYRSLSNVALYDGSFGDPRMGWPWLLLRRPLVAHFNCGAIPFAVDPNHAIRLPLY